jgi:hypothetical protein
LPRSLARGPYGWPQVATFVTTGLLIASSLSRHAISCRAGGRAVSRSCCSPWVALILAGFRVDVPMLSSGSPATWHGGVHGIAFLLIIATGVLAPLTMALAMRGDACWRPITVMSLAAGALFVVFLFLPWGNASFLVAIVTVFAWITAVAVRLATYTS